MTFLQRFRALGWFLLAAAWFLFSDAIAFRAANGLSHSGMQELLYRLFLLFLLAFGYQFMSLLGQPNSGLARSLGLAARPGWAREWALGAALGWAGVIACVLPTALVGGLVVTAFTSGQQFLMLVLDVLALAAGTLAIEMAFRGYPFQRMVEAVGPATATIFMAIVYAIWWTRMAPTTAASLMTAFFLGWALALAYLRTRALWVSWGLHFAWAAAMGILFGLPMAGPLAYSPVIVTNSRGPTWLTGDGQGPEGSLFGVLVSIALLIAVTWATTDLKYKYGFDEIVPGGIPVDLDAAARQQHEAATAQAAEPKLVQITPAAASIPAAPAAAQTNEQPQGDPETN